MKVLFSILIVAISLMSFAQEARDPQNVLTVTGTAEVFATPDEAIVRLGVLQQAPTAQEAQVKANDVIQKLLSAAQSLKIAKENIQTSRMSLSPIYSNPGPNQPPRISGYQAQDQLSVRLKDFTLVGKVIDAGTAAGCNTVDGIDFQLRNSRGPRSNAYREAVADARSKADAIAEALGVKIMGVYDARTDSPGYVPPPRGLGVMRMEMAAATPVEPGQLEVSVTVTIRYRIG